jgi:hypothetical protein
MITLATCQPTSQLACIGPPLQRPFCVTPDYPLGTTLFITSIVAERRLCPVPSPTSVHLELGGTVSSITESVSTNFSGGTNTALVATGVSTSASGDVTISWSSVQGGTYIVDASTDMVTWADLSPSVTATGIVSQNTEAAAAQIYAQRFYKVKLSPLLRLTRENSWVC